MNTLYYGENGIGSARTLALLFVFCSLFPIHPLAWAQPLLAQLREIQQRIGEADGRGSFWDTAYRPVETRFWGKIPAWMEQEAKQRSVHAILDVGCGYGTLLALATRIYRMRPSRAACLDVTDYLKPSVMDRYGITFALGNVELPGPLPNGIDVMIFTEVLEHFNFQPVPTLKKLRAALAPGGKLFLSTPDAERWGRVKKYCRRLEDLLERPATGSVARIDDPIWVYSRKELERVLREADFRIMRLDYSLSIPEIRPD